MPQNEIFSKMVGSRGESLHSKFKMSYSILFNALSSQIIELEEIMRKSFGENVNYVTLKNLKSEKSDLEKKEKETKIKCEFIDIEETPPIFEYTKLSDELYEQSNTFYSVSFYGSYSRNT